MRTLLPALALLTLSAAALAEPPALTIYNQGFAVVRETVPLDLPAGASTARFAGLTTQLEPDSVVLRDPAGQASFRILEQSYRNDPVSEGLLLSLHEGKTIRFLIEEENGPDRTVSGKIVRSGYEGAGRTGQPVIEVEGELRFSLPGQPLFPALGSDAILKPTLTWQLHSQAAAKFAAELAYVTRGLTWQASYNLVLPEQGDAMDLTGWVTVENTSGKLFQDATLKLIAGDVQKLEPPGDGLESADAAMPAAAAAPAPEVQEKKFDEYHLYTLPRPTTLRDKETKQVEFIRAAGVKVQRIYEYEVGLPAFGIHNGAGVATEARGFVENAHTKVAVRLEFKNSEENHLGLPLPAGRMRFYRRDGAQLQFVGEDQIDHTPRDETLKLMTGYAFDLKGERKQTAFTVDEDQHRMDETFAVELRNQGDQPVEIRLVETLYRGATWKITESSGPYTQKDARTVFFPVTVPAHGQSTVTYKVHYTW